MEVRRGFRGATGGFMGLMRVGGGYSEHSGV